MLAEDDHDLRCVLARTLELRGLEVCAVASGTRVLEELANVMVRPLSTRSYDLLVTDVRMPGRDGLSVLAGLRRGGWRRPILVISAFFDDAVRRRVERLGATFMAKPVDPDQFGRVVRRLCAESWKSLGRRSEPIAKTLAGATGAIHDHRS